MYQDAVKIVEERERERDKPDKLANSIILYSILFIHTAAAEFVS